MKKINKILGGSFLIFLVFSTLVLGVRTETLDHGTNSLIAYDEMNNLTVDRTLTLNWSNNFTGYDGASDAEVVIAIYVPIDYGITSINNVTINDTTHFQKYNVSNGNCMDGMYVWNGTANIWIEGLNNVTGKTIWRTNCTLITINGTLQNPTGGFKLNIDINLSDSCVTGGCPANQTYELMFSDMITYKKLVSNLDSCNPNTYNSSANTTYCYKLDNGINYSCIVPGNQSNPAGLSCNITKGIGNMTNTTEIMDQGTTGKLVRVPEEEFVIHLQEKWNLMSIPLQPANNSLTSVLAPIEGNYTAVYGWNADPNNKGWVKHTSSINNLITLEPGKGYWIYCTNAVNLTIRGVSTQKDITLSEKWNLFGRRSTSSKSLTNALLPIEGNYTAVYGWNADPNNKGWVKHTPSINNLITLEPGKGYWIYMNNNNILP